MILFYAETSTSFLSTAKIGLSVTICQAPSIDFFTVRDSGEIHSGQRAANDLCITEVSPLAQSNSMDLWFCFFIIGCRGKKKKIETPEVFLLLGGTKWTYLRNRDKHVVLTASLSSEVNFTVWCLRSFAKHFVVLFYLVL